MIKSTAVVYKVTSAAKQPHECFNLQQYIHRPVGKRRIQYPCSAAFKEVEQYIPHSVWSYELQQRPQILLGCLLLWLLLLTSCYSNGSDRPRRRLRTDQFIVFARCRQCARWFLVQREFAPQMASRSVHPFLQGLRLYTKTETDTQTDHAIPHCSNRPPLRYAFDAAYITRNCNSKSLSKPTGYLQIPHFNSCALIPNIRQHVGGIRPRSTALSCPVPCQFHLNRSTEFRKIWVLLSLPTFSPIGRKKLHERVNLYGILGLFYFIPNFPLLNRHIVSSLHCPMAQI